MKLTTTLLAFIGSLPLIAQSEPLSGAYFVQLGNTAEHAITYTLTLDEKGTFLFHSFSNNKSGIPQEVNTYGKGTWKSEKNVIHFFSDSGKDLVGRHTLDFTGSKARFITGSDRNTSAGKVQTRLKFFKSGIFWMKGVEMVKT